MKTYYIKIGDPIEKAKQIGTTSDAQNSYYIYDNRYSDVTFYGESDFYSNSLHMRKTGTFDDGKLLYQSKKYNAYPEAIGSKLYIFTNDKAPNFKLMVADKASAEYAKWKTLIPEGSTVMQGYVVTKMGLSYRIRRIYKAALLFTILMVKRSSSLHFPS